MSEMPKRGSVPLDKIDAAHRSVLDLDERRNDIFIARFRRVPAMHVVPSCREEQEMARSRSDLQFVMKKFSLSALLYRVQIQDHRHDPIAGVGSYRICMPAKMAFVLRIHLDLVATRLQLERLKNRTLRQIVGDAGLNLRMNSLERFAPETFIEYFKIPGDFGFILTDSVARTNISAPLTLIAVELIDDGSTQRLIQRRINGDEVPVVDEIDRRWDDGVRQFIHSPVVDHVCRYPKPH
jgi:hypothetical protein